MDPAVIQAGTWSRKVQESENATLCENLKKLLEKEACKQDPPGVAPESLIMHTQGLGPWPALPPRLSLLQLV